MIVVSDTLPLNYLVLAHCEHVLPSLSGRVLTVPAVIAELEHPRAPAAVRTWVENSPNWLEIQAPAAIDPTMKLGPGETQAIALACELRAQAVLIDERKATKVALRLGLLVTGTLGVLVTASQRRLICLAEALDRLPATFRAPEDLLRELREKAADWEK